MSICPACTKPIQPGQWVSELFTKGASVKQHMDCADARWPDCPSCGGTGEIKHVICETCQGDGIVMPVATEVAS